MTGNKKQNYNFNSLAVKWGLLFFFLLLIISRNTIFFTDPRFWAEEATLYFSHAYTHSLGEQLTFVAAGYYSFINVISTALAHHLVSLESAPIVTTLIALSIQLLPAIIILFGNIISFSSIRLKITALLLLIFVMPNSEVWLNVINSQFYLAITTALILLHHSRSLSEKIMYYFVLLISGLTGLISLFLFPLFVIRAINLKNNEKWIQSAILLLTGLIQAYLILISDNGLREGDFDAAAFIFIFIIKVCLLPVLGVEITSSFVPLFKQILAGSWLIKISVIGLTVSLAWFLYNYIKPFLTLDTAYLFAASLLLFVFSVYGALGDQSQLIAASGSGRYFTAPNTLFYLSLLTLFAHNVSNGCYWRIDKVRWPLQLIIILVVMTGLFNFWSDKTSLSMAGPSWKQQILYNQDDLRNIMIWPKDWFVNLNKSDYKMLKHCQKNQFLTKEHLCLIFNNDKLKIKILLLNNQYDSRKYDLLTYKILKNLNLTVMPNEVIYHDLYNRKNNKQYDVKLKILQDGKFFSAVLMESKSL